MQDELERIRAGERRLYAHRQLTEVDYEQLRERLAGVGPAFRLNVRAGREERHWSQVALAQALALVGVTLDATAITRIETGQRAVKLEEAWALAAVLQVPLQQMYRHREVLVGPEDELRNAEHAVKRVGRAAAEALETYQRATDELAAVRARLGLPAAGTDEPGSSVQN